MIDSQETRLFVFRKSQFKAYMPQTTWKPVLRSVQSCTPTGMFFSVAAAGDGQAYAAAASDDEAAKNLRRLKVGDVMQYSFAKCFNAKGARSS